ncbi:MAG: hypothetical protein ACI3XR_03525 [Eubacteriales bacterium]
MKNKTLHKLLLPFVCLLSVICAAVQTLFLIFCYDPAVSLYQRGTPYLILPILFLVGLIVALAAVLSTPKSGVPLPVPGKKDSPVGTGPLTKIGALFLLIGAIFSGILLFYGNFLSDHAADLLQETHSATNTVAIAANLTKLSAYAGILAAVYPALLLITGKGDGIFGMITALWMLLLDLSIYFDNSVLLNDPVRLLMLVGLSAAVLWMTADLRLILGRASRRILYFYGIFLLPVLAACSLPMLIVTAMGIPDFTSRTLVWVALFGMALLILGRLTDLRQEDLRQAALPVAPDGDNPSETSADGDPTESDNLTGSADPDSKGESDSREKFSLKREFRRMMDAPDTDLYGLPDPDGEDEDDESGFHEDGDNGEDGKIGGAEGGADAEIFDISDLTSENTSDPADPPKTNP